MIPEALLRKLYVIENKSMSQIAEGLRYSLHKVSYWMDKYKITRRSISEAVYIKHNPDGDPFKLRIPGSLDEAKLFGLGIGLYWGEGTKANKNSVRLGNTDPNLIKKFIQFLVTFFRIKNRDLRFSLQLFSDVNVNDAIDFWTKKLRINRSQIGKPTVTISGSIGTYRRKSQFGVLTVYYHNKKLRNLLVSMLPM